MAVRFSLVRAFLLLAVGGGLLLVACDDDDAAVRTGVLAASDDGVVTISSEADVGDVGVTVSPAVDPSETSEAATEAGFAVFEYELGPDGHEFGEPVTVTVRLDAAELGLGEGRTPIGVLASGSSDGEFEGYVATELSRDGDQVVIVGETEHFSRLLVLVGTVWVEMEPFGHTGAVGVPWDVTVEVELESGKQYAFLDDRLEYDFFATSPWLSLVDPAKGEGELTPREGSATTQIVCDIETPELTWSSTEQRWSSSIAASIPMFGSDGSTR